MISAPDLDLIPGFVPDHQALFDLLLAEVSWDERLRARKTASFGFAYNYSGLTYPHVEMPAFLDAVCTLVEKEPTLGFRPNNCLLNYYPDGKSTMGFHSDSSEELAEGTGIAIVSLGSEREIVFRHKEDREHKVRYPLPPGSLLYMSKELQSSWLHAIPKSAQAGPRISLTFRLVVEGDG